MNYQPKLSQSSVRSIVTPASSGGDTCDLRIQGEKDGDIYGFAGSQQPSTTTALIFNPTTQAFTLDKIDTDFSFNLRSTPDVQSAKALAAQYPQLENTAPDLSSSSDEEGDMFDGGDDVPDPNNPYDYRHFLKRRRTSSPEPIALEASPRFAPTPTSAPPPAATPSPQLPRRSSKTKPKQRPQERARPQSKARAISPPRSRVAEEADADNEDSADDDGGLTIEMDPVTKPRHRFAAFGKYSGEGPISLRSAASSVSPAPLSVDSEEEEEGDRQGKLEEESDEDVSDEMHLPSPLAKAPTPTAQAIPTSEAVDEDMEDEEEDDGGDLEAELERELAEGDDDGGGVKVGSGIGLGVINYIDDSSSESEEE